MPCSSMAARARSSWLAGTARNASGIAETVTFSKALRGWGWREGAVSTWGSGMYYKGEEEGGKGGSQGGFGWDPSPSSEGPPVVPAEGGPKILKRKSSWHRRGRSKTLASNIGMGGGEEREGGPGGEAPPLLLRCTAVLVHHWGGGASHAHTVVSIRKTCSRLPRVTARHFRPAPFPQPRCHYGCIRTHVRGRCHPSAGFEWCVVRARVRTCARVCARACGGSRLERNPLHGRR